MDHTVTIETDVIITINCKGCQLGDIAVTTCDRHVTTKVGRRLLWASRGYVTKFTRIAFCLPASAFAENASPILSEDGILTIRIPPKGCAAFTEEDRLKVVPVPWAVTSDCGEHHVIPTARTARGTISKRSSTLPTEEALHVIEMRHGTTLTHRTTGSESSSKPVMAAQSKATPRSTQPDASTPASQSGTYNSRSVDVEQPDGDVLRSNISPFVGEVIGTYTASATRPQENVIVCANCKRVDGDNEDRYDEPKVIKRDLLPRASSSQTSSADTFADVSTVASELKSTADSNSGCAVILEDSVTTRNTMNRCAVTSEASSDEAGFQTVNGNTNTSSSELSTGHGEARDNPYFVPDTLASAPTREVSTVAYEPKSTSVSNSGWAVIVEDSATTRNSMNCCAAKRETSSNEPGSQTADGSAKIPYCDLSAAHGEAYDNHCLVLDTGSPGQTCNEKNVPIFTARVPGEVRGGTEYITVLKFGSAELSGEASEKQLHLKRIPDAIFARDCAGAGDSDSASAPTREVTKDKRKRTAKGSVLCCVLL